RAPPRTRTDRGALGAPRGRRRAAALLSAHRSRHCRGSRGNGSPGQPGGGSRDEAPAQGQDMTRRSRTAGWLFSLALLAYPRAFRRRFGAEMRAAADGNCSLREIVLSGLAERVTALEHAIWFPSHRPQLYTM